MVCLDSRPGRVDIDFAYLRHVTSVKRIADSTINTRKPQTILDYKFLSTFRGHGSSPGVTVFSV